MLSSMLPLGRVFVPGAVFLVLLTCAGCGSSDQTPTQSAGPPDEFTLLEQTVIQLRSQMQYEEYGMPSNGNGWHHIQAAAVEFDSWQEQAHLDWDTVWQFIEWGGTTDAAGSGAVSEFSDGLAQSIMDATEQVRSALVASIADSSIYYPEPNGLNSYVMRVVLAMGARVKIQLLSGAFDEASADTRLMQEAAWRLQTGGSTNSMVVAEWRRISVGLVLRLLLADERGESLARASLDTPRSPLQTINEYVEWELAHAVRAAQDWIDSKHGTLEEAKANRQYLRSLADLHERVKSGSAFSPNYAREILSDAERIVGSHRTSPSVADEVIRQVRRMITAHLRDASALAALALGLSVSGQAELARTGELAQKDFEEMRLVVSSYVGLDLAVHTDGLWIVPDPEHPMSGERLFRWSRQR